MTHRFSTSIATLTIALWAALAALPDASDALGRTVVRAWMR